MLLIVGTLTLSWLMMMAVHEAGHVLHARLSGGEVKQVVLQPLEFSRTDVDPNPRPLTVAWGGPIWGVLLPLLLWRLGEFLKLRWAYLLRFFAGFCLLANGAYIGVGWYSWVGDAGMIRALGTPIWEMIAFGLVCCGSGLYLWNGAGGKFGIGAAREEVAGSHVIGVSTALLVVVAVMIVAGRRTSEPL
jgi:hypothetical protein